MYYLFSDDEHWHVECASKTIREVLKEVKDRFQIKGRLRCTAEHRNIKEYRLMGSDYGFAIAIVYE